METGGVGFKANLAYLVGNLNQNRSTKQTLSKEIITVDRGGCGCAVFVCVCTGGGRYLCVCGGGEHWVSVVTRWQLCENAGKA